MSSHSKNPCGRIAIMRLAVAALLCSLGTLAAAQERPAPKWELYGGYSFFYPHADVHGVLPLGALPVSSPLESDPRGAGASVTYNFNRWLGLTGDISGNLSSGESGLAMRIDDAKFFNLSAGPKITLRRHYFSPFLEALLGDHRLTSEVFGHDDRFGFMAGGGVDLNLSRRFAWRVLRADYVFSNHQFGPDSVASATDVRGVRLQTGVVFMRGFPPAEAPASASCAIYPSEVMVGEPATATVTGRNFNPRHTLHYTWTSNGGTISGKDTASLDTAGVAGGSYSVTAYVSDPERKKGGEAHCMAAFIVKELPKNPPAISCSANPSTVETGTSSTIRCRCSSPDNVAVTVGGWRASGGSVSGTGGSSAALNTSGAAAGAIMVNASCSDSRGLNTQASAQVMVENPPPPSPEFVQLETRLALHSIYFATARPRVEKPTGGLLTSQEQTLVSLANDFKLYLQTKPDAHLILGGHADPRASVEYNQALSERRVERVKGFLIERGVPVADLETKAFGEDRNLTEPEVRDAIEQNPELTPEQRKRILDNLQTVLLASNRRVDITLSTTGQKSVRQYPFNAADSLTLLQQDAKKTPAGPATRRKAKPKARR
jgi:outer membrane protein OmpA-like peptidoglycan-associated protein